MRLLGLILAFALAGNCLGAESASIPRANEPTYVGKTLGEWIALTKDKDEKVRANAAYALGSIGSVAKTAVPALTELLTDKDEWVRHHAAEALGAIGPDAKTAIPALTKLLKDTAEHVGWTAASALGKIGPAAIPALTELLKDENELVPRWLLQPWGIFPPSRICSRTKTNGFGCTLLKRLA